MRHQSWNVDWRDPGVKVDMKVRPCDMSFKHGSRTVGKHEPYLKIFKPSRQSTGVNTRLEGNR